jgi:hypothetical protein
VWEIPARLIAAAVGSGSRPPSASSRLSEASYFGSQRGGNEGNGRGAEDDDEVEQERRGS